MRLIKSGKGLTRLLVIILGVALLAAACGEDATSTPVPEPTPTRVPGAQPTPTTAPSPTPTTAPSPTPTTAPSPTPEPVAKKGKLIFADANWDSQAIQTRIAMFIAEHGYGYETDTVFGGSVILLTGLQKGDIDVSMEIWLPAQQGPWDNAVKSGDVVSLGKSLPDNWLSGFVVPTYVVEENPGLKSVFDLPEYKDVFATGATGGKARWVTCPTSWDCHGVTAQQVKAYGLEDVIDPVVPGGEGALFADLRGAYEKKQPWLGFMWGPTKPSLELDLTRLEEPSYTDECWESDKGCGYPANEIFAAVHSSVLSKAPDLVEFLRSWTFDTAEFIAVTDWKSANKTATNDEAALWYLENFQEVWTQSVPSDIADRVLQALGG